MSARVVIGASLLSLLGAGCAAKFYEPLEFSPDGTVVAHLCREIFMLAPDGALGGAEKVLAHWYAVDAPQRRRSATLRAGGVDSRDYEHDMAFSPDSRRLAIWSNVRVKIVDLSSGSARQVVHLPGPPDGPDAKLDSVAWISNSEIAYASRALSAEAGQTPPAHLTVRRLRVDGGEAAPKETFRSRCRLSPKALDTEVGRRNWSPDGRWLLLVDAAEGGGLTLLELTTGRRHLLDPAAVEIRSVAWRPDSAAVLCIVHRRAPAQPSVRLIGAADRQSIDLTAEFARAGLIEYSRELIWTGDGTHVFVDDSPYGDSPFPILRLRPFTVIPLGKRIKEKVGFFDPGYVPLPTPIRTCPVAGRVIAHAADGTYYLADYEGRNLVKIPGSVISADRKRIAGFDEKKHKLSVSAFSIAK